MKRLRLELKQTMDMYSTACKEALTAKQKAMELQRWKMEEEQKTNDSRITEDSAMAMIEREKARAKAAMEAAEASQRIAEMEVQKRITAEKKLLKEAEERKSRGAGGGFEAGGQGVEGEDEGRVHYKVVRARAARKRKGGAGSSVPAGGTAVAAAG